MSHSTNAKRNNGDNRSRVYFKQYLYNSSEPRDDVSHDTPPELEVELLENSYQMRQRFRTIAKHLRKNYS